MRAVIFEKSRESIMLTVILLTLIKGDSMSLLVENEKYKIRNEYETVVMEIKTTEKSIQIGDFYGEPNVAVISKDEMFCAMGGCGVIVYFLEEPFDEYQYHCTTSQWKEWGRETSDDTTWVENIKCLDSQHMEIEIEDGSKIILNVYKEL